MKDHEPSSAQKEKSSAILDAARAHFAAHGFEATKLSEVAKASGVAVGTIYLRYKGKAELLAGVLDEVEQSFCDAIDTPEIWAMPFPARFSAVVSAILTTAKQEEDLAKLMALAAFAPTPHPADKQGILLMIENHMKDGLVRGELRADLDLRIASRMAHGMLEGALRELMSNPKRDPNHTVAHVTDAYSRWLTTSQPPK
ncbi:MAG: TetR/AcrR family transcriptional regulator [Pseudomonadota bacterium]